MYTVTRISGQAIIDALSPTKHECIPYFPLVNVYHTVALIVLSLLRYPIIFFQTQRTRVTVWYQTFITIETVDKTFTKFIYTFR